MVTRERTPGRAFCPKCGQKYAVPEAELKARPGLRFRATCRTCDTPFGVRWHSGGLETDIEELLETDAANDRDVLAKGARVGKYEIVGGALASGGSATVYKAFEMGANRTVALKVLHRAADGEFAVRFQREVEVQGNLKHPNLMPIFDQGTVAGKPFYTMELLHKPTTLETIVGLFRSNRLGYNPSLRSLNSVEALLHQVMLPVARAIEFANKNGIIHRDLKPSNVIVDARTLRVYVIDFGICHVFRKTGTRLVLRGGGEATEAGKRKTMGTMRFMPPEQASGEVDERGDVWALGALLHYILSGDAPIAPAIDLKKVGLEKRIANLRKIAASCRAAGDDEEAAFYEQRVEELSGGELRSQKDMLKDAQQGNYLPLPAGVDRALAAIVRRAMEVDPKRRYPSAGAFAAEISARLEGRPVRAYAAMLGPGTGALYRGRLYVRRNRNVVIAASVVLALAAITMVFLAVRSSRQADDRIDLWIFEARASTDLDMQEDRLTKVLARRPDHTEAKQLLAVARAYRPIRQRVREARKLKQGARDVGADAKMAAVLDGSVIPDLKSLPKGYPGRRLLREARDLSSFLRGVRIVSARGFPRGVEISVVPPESGGDPAPRWQEARSWGKAPLDVTSHPLESGSYVMLVRRGDTFPTLHLPFVVTHASTRIEMRCPIDPSRIPPGMLYVRGAVGMTFGDVRFSEKTRSIKVAPFLMDAYEVTNAEYSRYIDWLEKSQRRHAVPRRVLQDGSGRTAALWTEQPDGTWAHPAGSARYPVTGVSLLDARNFARWAEKRLPTPEEWELAARGVDGREYPFGLHLDISACNVQTGILAEVGSYPIDRSPFGAYDMAGNVAEWTGGSTGEVAIVKGGSFAEQRYRAIVTSLDKRRADLPWRDVGFRCARSVE